MPKKKKEPVEGVLEVKHSIALANAADMRPYTNTVNIPRTVIPPGEYVAVLIANPFARNTRFRMPPWVVIKGTKCGAAFNILKGKKNAAVIRGISQRQANAFMAELYESAGGE